jgi:hypothetical protein
MLRWSSSIQTSTPRNMSLRSRLQRFLEPSLHPSLNVASSLEMSTAFLFLVKIGSVLSDSQLRMALPISTVLMHFVTSVASPASVLVVRICPLFGSATTWVTVSADSNRTFSYFFNTEPLRDLTNLLIHGYLCARSRQRLHALYSTNILVYWWSRVWYRWLQYHRSLWQRQLLRLLTPLLAAHFCEWITFWMEQNWQLVTLLGLLDFNLGYGHGCHYSWIMVGWVVLLLQYDTLAILLWHFPYLHVKLYLVLIHCTLASNRTLTRLASERNGIWGMEEEARVR